MLTVENYQSLKQLGHTDRQVQDLLNVSGFQIREFKKQNQLVCTRKPVSSNYQLKLSLLGDGSPTSPYGDLRQKGWLDYQICEALNITPQGLSKWKAEASIIKSQPRRLHLLTLPDYQQHVENGLGDAEIAKLFQVTSHAVRQWRKRRGIPNPKMDYSLPTHRDSCHPELPINENASP